ncbi:MAG: sigma-54-dependent Fis family transcriptional regulator [Deltaproteobacteria bacterium]|nr:sigma-54-dependent Fis family transcriptional regulator [Deltaproteobacteria bacterium]
MSPTVLIVEDDDALRGSLQRYLSRKGMNVLEASNCAQGFEILAQHAGDIRVVIVDTVLVDGQGFELVDRAAGIEPAPAVIVMTGDSNIDNAILALQRGAADFLLKPFSFESLDSALIRFIDESINADPNPSEDSSTHSANRWRNKFAPGVLGHDPKLMRLFEVLESVADTECSVLINGEVGTGKELVARALHGASKRRNRAFVTVNCSAVPENLLEEEIFGHAERFDNGEIQRRPGRLAQAEGGAVFLDEIAEMPLNLQAKLLRAIQEREITTLGEADPRPIDVRVIAASNKDLDEMIKAGRFREDLLYRLNAIPIELPALRERRGDIPLLVQHFIRLTNQRRSRSVSGIENDAIDALIAYDWPGNIRQLENTIERIVLIRSTGDIRLEDIPNKIRRFHRMAVGDKQHPVLPADGIDLREAVEQFENALILQALERTGWNKNRAATILQINRTTLVEKLKKKGWTQESKVKISQPTILVS